MNTVPEQALSNAAFADGSKQFCVFDVERLIHAHHGVSGPRKSDMPLQSAVIPYRYDEHGVVQVLLITSRKRGRWVLPKGHVPHGMGPHQAAAKEAFEEAGVLGHADDLPIASYIRKDKRLAGEASVRIEIYPMAVTAEVPVWPEMHERLRRWATVADALSIIRDKQIQRALTTFDDMFSDAHGRQLHEGQASK